MQPAGRRWGRKFGWQERVLRLAGTLEIAVALDDLHQAAQRGGEWFTAGRLTIADLKVNEVLASPLARAIQTAEPLAQHFQLGVGREEGLRAWSGKVLLISEDLDEIFALSDRIAVLFEGELMGEAVVEEASREQIGLWMSGVRRG